MPRLATKSIPAVWPSPPVRRQSHTAQSKIRVLRVWRRAKTHMDAELLIDDECRPIVICDVSKFGVGIVGAHDARIGQPVCVQLADGRKLAARVRWRLGDRCGLALTTPLAESDPLISGMQSPPRPGPAKSIVSVSDHLITAAITTGRKAVLFLGGWLRQRNAERRKTGTARLIERACREQGFSWLAEDDAVKPSRQAGEL